jgi:hypothetical protein
MCADRAGYGIGAIAYLLPALITTLIPAFGQQDHQMEMKGKATTTNAHFP